VRNLLKRGVTSLFSTAKAVSIKKGQISQVIGAVVDVQF
jgi:hypothetical protein